jgi:hypothetical protein
MKPILIATVLLLSATSSIPYFKRQRDAGIPEAGQRYVVVDETVWLQSRSDLGDLRLYSSGKEIPYALITQRSSHLRSSKSVRVLQPSRLAGKTRFLIDMSGIEEYDQVDLDLERKQFVAHALVEGRDSPQEEWASLRDNILYDLTKERLGRNVSLRLPFTRFRYLRVSIDGPVLPEDVRGASSRVGEEVAASWRELSPTPRREELEKDTVLTFDVPDRLPVERVSFDIAPGQPDFLRRVEIENEEDRVLATGEIHRVHRRTYGRRIDSDKPEVDVSTVGPVILKAIIHNGDDLPLSISAAHLKQYERRLYFEASASGPLVLYYGDERLEPPEYDYARLFQRDTHAGEVQLGPDLPNLAFTGRPDERPWMERHSEVLWIAIGAALVVLGTLAVRAVRRALV